MGGLRARVTYFIIYTIPIAISALPGRPEMALLDTMTVFAYFVATVLAQGNNWLSQIDSQCSNVTAELPNITKSSYLLHVKDNWQKIFLVVAIFLLSKAICVDGIYQGHGYLSSHTDVCEMELCPMPYRYHLTSLLSFCSFTINGQALHSCLAIGRLHRVAAWLFWLV